MNASVPAAFMTILSATMSPGQAPQESGGTKPRPIDGFAPYFIGRTYPADARRDHAEGRTEVVLEIGANGLVSRCTVERSAGHPALDRETCERAILVRFEPARNAAGEPVPARYPLKIAWAIE
jgi:periplasmic protein TonB